MYQWRQYQYVVNKCDSLELGQKYHLIGRVIPSSDKFVFHTKKLAIQSITPIVISNNSVNARWGAVAQSLIQLRVGFLESVLSSFSTPDQKIMAAVLTGNKEQLTDEQRHLIEVTGMQHAFAVSGQHLGIVLTALRPWLRRFWGYHADLPLVIVAWVLAWLVGTSASMVRAALTVTGSAFISWQWRRPVSAPKLLMTVVFVMLVVKPWWLVDIGFQLTLAAMVGVLMADTLLSRWQKSSNVTQSILGTFAETEDDRNASSNNRNKIAGYMRETAVVTAVVTTIVAPLTVWHFQSISFLSVVANVLVLWLFPSILASAATWSVCYFLIQKAPFLVGLGKVAESWFELPTRLAMSLLGWLSQFDELFFQLEVQSWRLILIYYLVVAISWRFFVSTKRRDYRLVY